MKIGDPFGGLRAPAPAAGLRERVLAAARQAVAQMPPARAIAPPPGGRELTLRRWFRVAALVLLALNCASWWEERGRVAEARAALAGGEPVLEVSLMGVTLRLRLGPRTPGLPAATAGAAPAAEAGISPAFSGTED